MYQTQILQIDKATNQIVVLFDNGAGDKFTEGYPITTEADLKERIAARIKQAETKPVEVGPIDSTPPVVVPPDPDPVPDPIPDDGHVKFFDDMMRLELLKKIVTLGIIAEDNAAYTKALDDAKKSFKPEFF